MSGRFFWHGAALLGVILLAVGIARWEPGVLSSGVFAADRGGGNQDPFAEPKPAKANAERDPFAAPGPDRPRAEKKRSEPQPGRPRQQPKPATAEAAIEEVLKTPTDMEFHETPLSEVTEFLERVHGVRIVLDRAALDDLGVQSDTPVSMRLRGVSLESALNLLLRNIKADLAWTIDCEVLLVTSKEEANSRLFVEVYDVADLVVCQDEKGALWDDYETLVEMLTSNVEPDSWDDLGGPGAITGATISSAKVLVVTQTYSVHREIRRLLAELRKLAAKGKTDGKPPVRPRPSPPTATAKGYPGRGGMGAPPQAGGSTGIPPEVRGGQKRP